MSLALTMYTTSWCGDCHRLKAGLRRAGVAFTEVDIEQDSAAAEFMMRSNGGNRSVPTVVMPDGTVLGEPSTREVLARLTPAATGADGP
jgi:mycoredoxin